MEAAQRLIVRAPGVTYPIVIAEGGLTHLPMLHPRFEGRCGIVTNPTLATAYGESLVSHLPNAVLMIIPEGEAYKTLATVGALYDQFITAGLDRAAMVVALGGGVVGDTAGFAAATYLRGVAFAQLPTSLLAMVDSSVGGKVGVDLPQGKNLVGAFKQPAVVVIDPHVLTTLPAIEYCRGMAEVIKHALIADPELIALIRDRSLSDAALIRRAVQVKIDVVQRDPYEQGERAHLNLGHTFAHALEQVSGYAIAHGEAVAIGLAAAMRLSVRVGMGDRSMIDQVDALLDSAGLPRRIDPAYVPEAIYAAMATDKKWLMGRSRFVLLDAPGQPRVVEGVAREDVLAVIQSLQIEYT